MNGGIPTALDTSQPGVTISGIRKKYGDTIALNDLYLTVPEESVYLFVGPNGSGKTTTMNILLDLVRPDRGTASVFGLDPQQQGARVRTLVGYMPEQRGFGYPWLQTGRMLAYHAAYYPSWDPAYSAKLVSALEVDPDKRYGRLSKGEARRVHFIMTLAHRPPPFCSSTNQWMDSIR
ncbi:ATP-binding cassette domain-containing protein [Gemmatimonadota bacterium]